MRHSEVGLRYSLEFDAVLFRKQKTFQCPKSGLVRCHNIVTYFYCTHLRDDRRVESFFNSAHRFEYYKPNCKLPGRGTYALDVKREGKIQLVYVTSQAFLHHLQEELIIEAAEANAERLGFEFVLVTEPDVFGEKPEYMRSLIDFLESPESF